ncbi:unnamed protein product [Amoebophrya sp. A25]|nr:unnamed protein product [Amoebophrya sp. A25]|eukprot:GSA25T00003209001.1
MLGQRIIASPTRARGLDFVRRPGVSPAAQLSTSRTRNVRLRTYATSSTSACSTPTVSGSILDPRTPPPEGVRYKNDRSTAAEVLLQARSDRTASSTSASSRTASSTSTPSSSTTSTFSRTTGEGGGRIAEITKFLRELNEADYREAQVLDGVYRLGAQKWYDIPHVPKSLQYELSQRFSKYVSTLNPVQCLALSADGGSAMKDHSVRQLFTMRSDFESGRSSCSTEETKHTRPARRSSYIETLYCARDASLSLSSQDGCAFAGSYSRTKGFRRQLTADEICDQVLYFRSDTTSLSVDEGSRKDGGTQTAFFSTKQAGDQEGLPCGKSGYHGIFSSSETLPIRRIDFDGIGEPLANPNIFEAMRLLTELVKISPRRIHIHTAGVVPSLRRLVETATQVKSSKNFFAFLAQLNLVLHVGSVVEEERDRLLPLNRVYPLADVLTELDALVAATGRRIVFLYELRSGENDSTGHAVGLARLIHNRKRPDLCHVELRSVDSTEKMGRKAEEDISSEDTRLEAAKAKISGESEDIRFARILGERGVSVSVRPSDPGRIQLGATFGQQDAAYRERDSGSSIVKRGRVLFSQNR